MQGDRPTRVAGITSGPPLPDTKHVELTVAALILLAVFLGFILLATCLRIIRYGAVAVLWVLEMALRAMGSAIRTNPSR